MNDNTYQELLHFAGNVAQDAGEIIRDYFYRSDKGATTKDDQTPVTEADKRINELVIECVNERYPAHGVLGEEASVRTDSRELWVCDPIDGTSGFIYGLPTSAFSLAYVVDGEPEVAVIFDPYQRRLFAAAKNGGTTCNGQSVRVSTHGLAQASIGGPGGFKEVAYAYDLYKTLSDKGVAIRLAGGLVFQAGQVAEGRIDGRIFIYRGAHDMAAAQLIVEEAGGKVTDLEGNRQRYDQPIRGAIMSNGVIHDDLVQAVRDFGTSRLLGETA